MVATAFTDGEWKPLTNTNNSSTNNLRMIHITGMKMVIITMSWIMEIITTQMVMGSSKSF